MNLLFLPGIFLTRLQVLTGLSKTEYLVTFLAIILGYIASEYFKGFALLYRRRKNLTFSISYILFVFSSFLIITILWWDFYFRSLTLTDSLINLLLALVYLLFFYILSIVLFRDLKKMDPIHLESYFESKRPVLFSLIAVFLMFDLIATLKSSHEIIALSGISICIMGVFIKNKTFIKAIIIAGTFLVILYQFISFNIRTPLYENIPQETSFTKAEHLTIFISLIYAYVVTIYFKGWSYLLRDLKNIKSLFIPIFWSSFSFLLLITVWWNTWIRSQLITTNIVYFQASLVPPLLLFVIALIIFPGKKTLKEVDLNSYFDEHRIQFFSAFLLFFFFNLLLSILFKELELTGITNIFRFVAILFAILGIIIKNRMFHKILPVSAFIILIIYIIGYN